MKELEERILKDGTVLPGEILKVGSFLNQQMDIQLLTHMGQEVARLYKDEHVTKVLTIEASGIAFAVAIGMAMNLPVVFAKKGHSSNVNGETYKTVVHSYTHGTDYTVEVPKSYLLPEDRVLIADDFLAKGKAAEGLLDIIGQSGASVAGLAIEIEKYFQDGGRRIRERGIRVESLALIASMDGETLTFASDPV